MKGSPRFAGAAFFMFLAAFAITDCPLRTSHGYGHAWDPSKHEVASRGPCRSPVLIGAAELLATLGWQGLTEHAVLH
jgi:hypothetical protein